MQWRAVLGALVCAAAGLASGLVLADANATTTTPTTTATGGGTTATAPGALTGTTQTTRATLTPDASQPVQVAGDQTVTSRILFTADPALAPGITFDQDGVGKENAISAVLTDFRSGEGALFQTATIADTNILAGRTQLEVIVHGDPVGELETGDYAGQVVVSGSGVTPARSPLTFKFSQSPPWSERRRWLLAILVLLAGVLAGSLLAWLNSHGAKLVDANRRLASLETRFRGDERWLPSEFQRKLAVAREAVMDFDQARATAELDSITAQQESALAALIGDFNELEEQLQAAQAAVSRSDLNAAARQRMQSAISAAESNLSMIARHAWPPEGVSDEMEVFAPAVPALTTLATWWATADRWSEHVEAAAKLFVKREWAEAQKAVADLREAAVQDAQAAAARGGARGRRAEGAISDADVVLDLPPAPMEWIGSPLTTSSGDDPLRPWRHLTWWTVVLPAWLKAFGVRHFNFVAGMILALAVVTVGLSEVFDPDTTFTDTGEDILKLLAWGFGVQLTGVTLTQLGSALGGKSRLVS